MKKVLIISPYFPPSNAADMQRIRMSLPFYKDFGWEAEIVCVAEKYTDAVFDYLLVKSVPQDIKIHHVNALNKEWTSKIGLGSIALRSLWYYKAYINRLLKTKKFDLIYFSTTQYPVCILGAYWKKKYGIPYIIDMQDPWFTDYYKDKPKHQQPKKFWFSYRLDKYLEPIAMKSVDGIMAVSSAYITELEERYENIRYVPSDVITFGGFKQDLQIAEDNQHQLRIAFDNNPAYKHIVYVGRGGYDMQKAVHLLLSAFKKGLKTDPQNFGLLRFHFIGTSYAPLGQGNKTLFCIAEKLGLENYVNEDTDRISFYESIYNLQQADALFIPGHEFPAYTASKIYPYILLEKPLLAIFNMESSAAHTLTECNAGDVANISNAKEAQNTILSFLSNLANSTLLKKEVNWARFEKHRARSMTKKQCDLFDRVIGKIKSHNE
ncbi:glycosyltransferase [Pedobacter soli]|uniref:Glycosyltransferase involved in cell wall bisynthesis n=1 Tax=Pedobacter soli TaxID=390242 RepID=A0A1G6X169_9SPHI|nr:glycosyltransferase [Pedobacter soli]SDD71851.1 Glycosyltransferase involved in cell wall bisynthesis [Pedobacter soli]